jgi:hypothetical protein
VDYPLRSAAALSGYYLQDGKEPPGVSGRVKAAGAAVLTGRLDAEVYGVLFGSAPVEQSCMAA